MIRSFINELIGIQNGNGNAETLQKILGKNRVVAHGTWEEWARMMLVWMANYRRQ